MDTLSIPFGTDLGGFMNVYAEDEFGGGDAVAFELPTDGRVIAREHIAGLVEWLQGFLEETKPQLPALQHATIRATVTTSQGQTQNVVLSRVDEDETPWRSAELFGDTRWFGDEDIASFEVLFPGVEA